LLEPKEECPFAARCPIAIADCLTLEPPLVPIAEDENRRVACIRSEEISQGKINGETMYPVPEFAPDKFEGIPFEQRGVTLEVKNLNKQFPLMKGSEIGRASCREGEVCE